MPSQITPAVTTVTNRVDIDNDAVENHLDVLLEISRRIHKQLEQITGLKLKEGEI